MPGDHQHMEIYHRPGGLSWLQGQPAYGNLLQAGSLGPFQKKEDYKECLSLDRAFLAFQLES